MATNRAQWGTNLLRAVLGRDADAETDGHLLRRFLTRRDEGAFAALVRRHGPMVLGVCRRVLGNAADADDAFQATFLVLVRKGPALLPRAVLGDWLHGVARRTALKARAAAAHRRMKEQMAARPEPQTEPGRDDWLPLLDEALARLPEKYRQSIVLCDLEGRTREEAAALLGWPPGTVAGRLRAAGRCWRSDCCAVPRECPGWRRWHCRRNWFMPPCRRRRWRSWGRRRRMGRCRHQRWHSPGR